MWKLWYFCVCNFFYINLVINYLKNIDIDCNYKCFKIIIFYYLFVLFKGGKRGGGGGLIVFYKI